MQLRTHTQQLWQAWFAPLAVTNVVFRCCTQAAVGAGQSVAHRILQVVLNRGICVLALFIYLCSCYACSCCALMCRKGSKAATRGGKGRAIAGGTPKSRNFVNHDFFAFPTH